MSDKKWDTSKGRKWVVVAFWGVETTVEFYRDEDEADHAYSKAVENGADAFCARTTRMEMQCDAETKLTPSGFVARDAKRARTARKGGSK